MRSHIIGGFLNSELLSNDTNSLCTHHLPGSASMLPAWDLGEQGELMRTSGSYACYAMNEYSFLAVLQETMKL